MTIRFLVREYPVLLQFAANDRLPANVRGLADAYEALATHMATEFPADEPTHRAIDLLFEARQAMVEAGTV